MTVSRIPLNTLAIPLGLTGLAEVWSDAVDALGLPVGVGEIFWVLAAVAWLGTIAAHTVRGARSDGSLLSQLKHPVQGPLAALVPIVGMLLGVNLHSFWALGGTVLAALSIAATALFLGWIVGSWLNGGLQLESVHGGYFLPTVAGSYVASYAGAVVGARPLAIGAFVVGSLFWVSLFTVLVVRFAFRPPLPAPLVPTMAIMMAPPAVATGAWLAIDGGRGDVVAQALATLTVVMVLIQLALLPRYLRLPFSLGFWSFTFPTAYVAVVGIVWLHLLEPIGWQVLTIALVVGVTALITAIAVRSIRVWRAGRRPAVNTAEAQLDRADEAITPGSAPA